MSLKRECIKVLLVDDDEDDYIVTNELLTEVEGNNYELQWVSSYEDALDEIHNTCYDVLLFDYRLGAHSGLDLVRESMASGCTAPVILLTGQSDHDTDIAAIKAGASDYLHKAEINPRVLERSIRYAIERKRTEERILRMAYYDSLTNLPNRSLFHDRLQQALAHARRYGGSCAILFIDLDNFKRINDTLEHRIGDMLLTEVAERLHHDIRSSDTVARDTNAMANTVARLGGDEFTVLLTDLESLEAAALVAQRILDTLTNPFHLEEHEVFVGASIGIAAYPKHGEDMDTLIKHADTAMYYAKGEGKNNYQFYRKSMNSAALELLSLENSLRKALNRDELLLHFQPRFSVSTGESVGIEALMRWNHPERGLVLPSEFIPLAEECGLAIPISKWMINAACRQYAEWQEQGFMEKPVILSLNLSGQHLQQRSLMEFVQSVLETHRINPGCLEFEIAEGTIMKHALSTITLLENIRERGIRISMDDFGTGYSSLTYLKRFPLNSIKIDHSFIQEMTVSADNGAIVKAIIAMAHTLNLTVIAEGVETDEQMSILRNLECDEVQGFLSAPPLPADKASDYLLCRV